MTVPTRIDPIREKYFKPIERAESWSQIIFTVSAALSIAAAVIQEEDAPHAFRLVQLSFMVSVIILFVLDQMIRLYLSPRAADARALDFFSRAYGQALSHERTHEYYNSPTTTPQQAIAAQTFENALFTKEIANRMWKRSAPIAILYVVAWLSAVIYRDTPLPLLATCVQVVFGEQIIAKFLRLFWLQWRCEQVFSDLASAFTVGINNPTFGARVMVIYTKYEAAKALAGVTLSSKIFEKANPQLSATWDQLKRTHAI